MPAPPSAFLETRYEPLLLIATGGMATVHVGAVRGALGFRQLVAIKRPHPHLLLDPDYRQEMVTEARLASLIHHANVVAVRDVEVDGEDVRLVMDYVEGASLAELIRRGIELGTPIPPSVVLRIVIDACTGLHAAHEQEDEQGRPLCLVHRDVSPQNLLVGLDGVTRVTDFGVAQFARTHGTGTKQGILKGKFAYMAPEYVLGEEIDRRADIFGLGVVLWEALTERRLFRGAHEAETLQRILTEEVQPLSRVVPSTGAVLDRVVGRALEKSPAARFPTAAAMAEALEDASRGAGWLASPRDVGQVVERLAGPELEERRETIRGCLAGGKRAAVASPPGARAAPMTGHTPSGGVTGPTARSTSTPPPSETATADLGRRRRAGAGAPTRAAAAIGAVAVLAGASFGLSRSLRDPARPHLVGAPAPEPSPAPSPVAAPPASAPTADPPPAASEPVPATAAPPLAPATRPTHAPRSRPSPSAPPAVSTPAPRSPPPNPYADASPRKP